MTYTVEITEAASEAIRAQAHYIAVDCQAPLNASRWLVQVWDVIRGLALMPSRHNLAPESASKTYEVRRALAGEYMVLFTINEAAAKVRVIGFRHGRRMPRPGDLPDAMPEDEPRD